MVRAFSARELDLLPVYDINANSRESERAFMEAQLRRLGVEATRVVANENSKSRGRLSDQDFTEAGNHLLAWRHVAKHGNEPALILDDSVILVGDVDFGDDVARYGLVQVRFPAAGRVSRLKTPAAWSGAYLVTTMAIAYCLGSPLLGKVPTAELLFGQTTLRKLRVGCLGHPDAAFHRLWPELTVF